MAWLTPCRYFIAYVLFIVWLFPSGFAQNLATLVVTRFFGGGASSVAINLVGGTISDIWDSEKARSLPMSLFGEYNIIYPVRSPRHEYSLLIVSGFTSIAGIALGPFVGSAIVQLNKHNPWRWVCVMHETIQ